MRQDQKRKVKINVTLTKKEDQQKIMNRVSVPAYFRTFI